jgi:hypothetical protein
MGSLKAHKQELADADENVAEKGKSITLKAGQKNSSQNLALKASKDSSEDEDFVLDDDDDDVAMLSKKFAQLWKERARNKKGFFQKKDQKGDANAPYKR